ncbi:MAG: hypothetical protein J6Z49_03000 [Kiritimatiellae bacterium]|nr:hypothetical protein [Kiritimatiellia bacterium]
MSMYDEIKAIVAIGDLAILNSAANCFEYSDGRREDAEKREVELRRICEEQAAEIQQLRTNSFNLEAELKKIKVAADTNAGKRAGEFLRAHNSPFESQDIDEACEIILGLLETKEPESKPRELSPYFKQRVENAAEVLHCLTPVVANQNDEYPDVGGDRYNTMRKTLDELYKVIMDEVMK